MAMLLALAALSASASAATEGQRYNVMYMVVDDLRPEFLAAYGQQQMKTPHIDRLAATGLVFNNAYCQQAVCGPSRASFMTGRRPSHTRVFDNAANFRLQGVDSAGMPGSEWTTCPEHFKKSGWLTLGGGKTFHPDHPKDWDEPRSWSPDMPYFPFSYFIQPNMSYPQKQPCFANSNEKSYSCASGIDTFCAVDEPDDHFYDFTLAQNTVKQLRYAANHRPFFIQSGFARPHAPWRVPQRYWDLYDTADIKLAKHKYPPDGMPGIAWYQLGFYTEGGTTHCPNITKPIDDATATGMRHAYQASVSWLDAQVGTVLDELDTLGLAESTLVIIHGDHGWQLGEHNSWHKFTNFELGTRIPLIMRAPWIKTSIGKRSDMLVELIDVFPTIAALAGTSNPTDALDGVSLAPAFEDPSRMLLPTSKGTRDKSVAFSQFPHHNNFSCPWYDALTNSCRQKPKRGYPSTSTLKPSSDTSYMGYAVRTHSWRYVAWLPFDSLSLQTDWSTTPIHELYNHTLDPGSNFDEMDVVNVAYDAANADLVLTLFNQTEYFFRTVAPPAPGGGGSGGNATQCRAVGGIPDSKSPACCPATCGKCGGKDCGNRPGGKSKCCGGDVVANGKRCTFDPPPCST